MANKRLTAPFVRSAPLGKYFDGSGLVLQVREGKNGDLNRSWICRIQVGGKRREIGLGSIDEVTLADARRACETHRHAAKTGVDLREKEKAATIAKAAETRAKAARRMTFAEAAEAYIAANEINWKNAKHRQQWTNTLYTYAFPIFGGVAVADVDRAMVLKAVEPYWRTKNETASRVLQRIEKILDWAEVRGYRAGANPARWRNVLDKVLPPRNKALHTKHHASMAYGDVPSFFTQLRESQRVGAECLAFIILTGVRSGEARGATWQEIDLEARLWSIPPERMKMSRPHRVPLSEAAMAILLGRIARYGEPHPSAPVFVSDFKPGSILSDMTLNKYLKSAGIEATVHGFRTSFRTWAGEQTAYPSDVCEAALAHVNTNRVEAAYLRSDFLDQRRRLMDEWARFVSTPEPISGSVIPLKGRRARGGENA